MRTFCLQMSPMKKYFAIMLILAGAAGSCKKEDDTGKTRTQLISRTWVPESVLFNGERDYSPYYAAISWTFRYNGTYTFIDPDGSTEGQWEFNSDETQVVLDKGAAHERTWEILSLTSKQWKIKYTAGDDTFEITLKST